MAHRRRVDGKGRAVRGGCPDRPAPDARDGSQPEKGSRKGAPGQGDLEALRAMPAAAPFSPMPGRMIPGHATLPAGVVSDDAALDACVERALAFAASLPAN